MWRVFRTFFIPSTATRSNSVMMTTMKPTDLETTGRAHTLKCTHTHTRARAHTYTDLYLLASPPSKRPRKQPSARRRLWFTHTHTYTHTHAHSHVYNIMLSDGQASRFHHTARRAQFQTKPSPNWRLSKTRIIMVYIFYVCVYQSV